MSEFYNGISFTGKIIFWYQIRAQISFAKWGFQPYEDTQMIAISQANHSKNVNSLRPSDAYMPR